jgi:hypothetical protein
MKEDKRVFTLDEVYDIKHNNLRNKTILFVTMINTGIKKYEVKFNDFYSKITYQKKIYPFCMRR